MPVAEERGVTKAAAKSCPCEACKKVRKEPSKVMPLDIHSYSSQPRDGWVKQRAADDVATPTLFMGVELETTVPDRSRDISRILDRELPVPQRPPGLSFYSDEYQVWMRQHENVMDQRYRREVQLLREPSTNGNITAEEAVSLAEPVGFWHAKHDSSVSGPEFASLPGTLNYWRSIGDDLQRMFTGLLHGGMRSHSGDEAGMHISISLTAFEDSDHLVRFARLVNLNPSWSRRMSQRTAHSMHWCNVGATIFQPGNEHRLERWARQVMEQGYASQGNRYSALNAECGEQGRLEFRLPRGTLRYDRFMKNLEWVAAMVAFSSLFAATDSATFMRWVMSRTTEFPFLAAFLTEKFGVMPSDEAFTPAFATATDGNVPNTISDRQAERDDRYCPCGDGCYRNDCGNCDDPEPDYYEDDYDDRYEPQTYDCNSCSQTHDAPMSEYRAAEYDDIINGRFHVHFATGEAIMLLSDEEQAERRTAQAERMERARRSLESMVASWSTPAPFITEPVDLTPVQAGEPVPSEDEEILYVPLSAFVRWGS